MTLHRMALLGAFCTTLVAPARAQQPTGPAGWVQAEGYYHAVSNDFGDWKGLGLQLHAPVGSRTVWDLTGLVQEAFHDRGVWLGVGNRYQFHRDWFSYVAVGGGTGQYYFPDLRTDLTIGKSWLDRRNLVTMVSGTYVKAKRGYSDVAVQGSSVIYLPGVAIEAGGRINWSYPNAVSSGRGFAAVTIGRERHRVIVLRGSGGGEGYQLTGTGQTERLFTSWEGSIAWREWVSQSLGLVGRVEYYDNPFYARTGLTLGVFRHW